MKSIHRIFILAARISDPQVKDKISARFSLLLGIFAMKSSNARTNITTKALSTLIIAALIYPIIGIAKLIAGEIDISSLNEKKWVNIIANERQYIIVPATINGKNVSALVDTGASNTLIDSALAQDLSMKVRLRGQIRGTGGKALYYVADLTSLSIGGLNQRGGQIGVVDMSSLRGAMGHDFSMVIGADILASFAFEIDWDQSRLRLMRSGSKTLQGSSIPLRVESDQNRFVTEMIVGDRVLNQVFFDTGADHSAISKVLLPQIQNAVGPVTDIKGVGVGGETIVDFARVYGLRLGNASIGDLPIEFPHLVCPCSQLYEARMGMTLLRHFNVLVDASAGYIVLNTRASASPADRASTSGIQGILKSDGVEIVHVMRGSPAAKNGLKSGDRICAVDGITLGADQEAKDKRRGWSTDTPGRQVSLLLCDGRAKKLTLAKFY